MMPIGKSPISPRRVSLFSCFCSILLVGFLAQAVFAQARTASVDGDWSNTATWGGASVPTAVNTVTINNGVDVTVTASDAACASLTFSSNGGTITVSTPYTLAVTGNITFPSRINGNNVFAVSGTGTISCANVVLGTVVAPTGDRFTDLTSTITAFNVSGTVTFRSCDNGNNQTLPRFYLNSGVLDVNGQIVMTNDNDANCISLLTTTTAPQTGTLKLGFAGDPFSLSANGTKTIQLNGTGATVEYNGAAQTIGSASITTYRNLVLSNSGTKTLSANVATIGGDLVLSGTASTTTTAVLAIGGDLTIGDGCTFTAAGFNLNVGGVTTVGDGASGTFSISNNGGTKTFTGGVTVNAGATWDNDNVVEDVTIGGDFSVDAASTFNAGTGVYTFSGAVKTIGITSGTLTIPSITIAATGTYTATSAITSSTQLTTTAGGYLDMATYALSVNGITNGGTIYTQNTSATPLTAGKIWGGTVNYNAAGGGQTVVGGTYTTLTMGNTNGTQTAGSPITAVTLNTTAGGALDMGTHQLLGIVTANNNGTIKTQNTTALPIPLGLTWGGTIEYNGNGQTIVAVLSYNNLTISGTGAKTFAAVTPITINGDFTVTNGGTGTFTNLAGKTFNVGGNASLSGQSYATYLNLNPGVAWTLSVTGTLTANYAYIDFSNASGGSLGTATNSRDVGNNNNWAIQAVWDNGNGNNNWDTPANWVNDWLPGSCSDATFNGTSTANCNLNTAKTIQSITFTGDYTGTFDFSGVALRVTKNADFSIGGALGISGGSSLEFVGTTPQTFIPALSPVMPQIVQNGAGGATISTRRLKAGTLSIQAGTLNLGSGMTHTVSSIATSGGTLNFGSSTLQVTGNADLNGATITAGTGTLQFTGSGTQTFTPKATPATNPNILHTGTGTLDVTTSFNCGNFTQSAGFLDLSSRTLTMSGNFIINNGTSTTMVQAGLTGSTISFGGYALLNGTSSSLLNLNATNTWTITRNGGTGSITANYCNIGFSTASNPPGGYASQSTSSGNNNFWTFDAEDYGTWLYTKRIYVNTTSSGANITSNLTNFPMLVRLNTSNFNFGQSDGTLGNDVRFDKPDGTHLDYEIDNWVDNVSADIWVRLDTVYGNNNTQFFNIYWGKAGAATMSNSDRVFRATDGFAVVHHLNATLQDATPNNNNITVSTGTADAAGYIGRCRSFAGAGTLSMPNSTTYHATTAISMSAWIYGTGAWGTGVVTNQIFRKGQAMPYDYQMSIDEATPGIFIDTDDNGGYHSTTNLSLNTWYYLAVTWDGNNQLIYLNGMQDGYPVSRVTNITCDARTLDIGGPGGGNDYWTGSIDEPRVSLVARSADWVKLCYESQKNGSGVLIWPKTWDGDGGDGQWNTPANWSEDALPSASSDVVFNGTSAKGCTLNVTTAVKSINFSGAYTGNFSFGTTTRTLSVTGSTDFSTGGTITAGDGTLQFTGTSAQIFKPKPGQIFPAITQNGTGGTTVSTNGLTAGSLTISSGTFDLGDENLIHGVSSVTTGGGGLDFGTSTLQVTGNANLNGSTIMAGTGTLQFTGSGAQAFTPKAAPVYNPNISQTGTGTLTIGSNFNCLSFSQSDGILNFGTVPNDGYDITTSGNFTITNGKSNTFSNLRGVILTVGGNARFNGAGGTDSLNLNIAGGVWSVLSTGNTRANYCVIGRSTASATSRGQAAITCRDALNNTNWDFDTEDYSGGDWASSKRIYFDTSPSGANVTSDIADFPMLIRLNPNDFAGAQADGSDIRFESSSGAPLSYEIERWSGSNAEIWVLVPIVYGNNKSQYIKMWWDNNTGVSTTSNSAAVFGSPSSYVITYHFNGNVADATSNNYNLTVTGTNTYAEGNIASARSQNGGAGNYLRRTAASAYLNNVTATTVSAWVSKTNVATNTRSIIDLYNSGTDRAYLYYNTTNRIYTYNDINDYSLDHTVTGWTPTNNTWFHVAWVMDNTNWLLYINGELKAGTPQSDDLDDINNNVQLGVGCLVSGTANNWDGMLDEVRIADVPNSADYIKLCYESQKANAMCVFFSDAPTITGPADSGLVAVYQKDKDSVIVRYEVEDPQGGNVTISSQYKVSGGSWTAMTSTNGTGSIPGTDGSVTRQIGWRVRSQLGAVENSYFVRIIADDGAGHFDTTESALFLLDTRGPAGIGTLVASNATGTSIRLTWSAVTDTNWHHFKIWYGTVRNDVRDSTGTAAQWNSANDPALLTRTTTTTTITGLSTATTYYFKIWAFDSWGNSDTAANIAATTLNAVAPAWTQTGLGIIQGGAITENELYVGTGANGYSLQKRDLGALGAEKWSYSTFPDACRMPTYNYEGGFYKIVASAGNNVIGVRDDGGTGKTQLFPKRAVTGPGNPYISTENSYFYLPSTNGLDKRNMSDGQSVATWPKALANISTAADIVIFNNDVYVATTTGRVYKYDFNGVPYGASFNTGAAINLPLVVSGSSLYITPTSAKLFKISTSTLDTVSGTGWEFALPAGNTGPCFVEGNAIYTACGNLVRKVIDNGSTASLGWTSASLGSNITSGPIPRGTAVYVGTSGGQFHALKVSDGTNFSSPKWPYTSPTGNVSAGPWIDIDRSRVLYGTSTGSGEVSAFTLE